MLIIVLRFLLGRVFGIYIYGKEGAEQDWVEGEVQWYCSFDKVLVCFVRNFGVGIVLQCCFELGLWSWVLYFRFFLLIRYWMLVVFVFRFFFVGGMFLGKGFFWLFLKMVDSWRFFFGSFFSSWDKGFFIFEERFVLSIIVYFVGI